MFIFYLTNNVLYWLYSFKQWAISVQVPKLVSSKKQEGNEQWLTPKRYTAIKWIGVAVIFLIVGAFASLRYILWKDADEQNEINFNKTEVRTNLSLLILTNACLLVSIVLMIDTYRRLKESFARNLKFRENKKVMVLQIYVLTFHILFEIALGITLEIAYDTHKLDDKGKTVASLKSLLIVVLFMNQVIVIYLLDRFSRPMKFDEVKASQCSTEFDTSSDLVSEQDQISDTVSSRIGEYISNNIMIMKDGDQRTSFARNYKEKYLDANTS